MTRAVGVALSPRPLARSLDPRPGESLAGYVRRLADRLDRTPRAVMERVGLHGAGSQAAAGLALSLPPPVLSAFAAACRLQEDEATALTLARHVGTVFAQDGRPGDSLVHQAGTAWVKPGGTRLCPDCLREHDGRRGALADFLAAALALRVHDAPSAPD